MKLDSDLQAIQEVRDFLQEAKAAQKHLEKMTQPQIDAIVAAMAEAAEQQLSGWALWPSKRQASEKPPIRRRKICSSRGTSIQR